jgi:hypothetical protein
MIEITNSLIPGQVSDLFPALLARPEALRVHGLRKVGDDLIDRAKWS